MTSSICASITTGTEGTLIDTRDNTTYYVGKMLDGNCWMLQNLALGSTDADTVLTSVDSNISSDWTLPAPYTLATDGFASNTPSEAIQSWSFGKWVLATPLLTTSCGTSGTSSVTDCTKVGLVDVSGSNFSTGYTATTRSWDGANATSSTLVAVNCTAWSGSGTNKVCTAGTYDAHYLIGNYYTWHAATAATGGRITSGQASGSICPKGWKLPTSNSSSVVGSFGWFLKQYGVGYKLSETVDGVDYNIAGAPLRFVRSGYIQPGSYFGFGGQGGYYWSSTPSSTASVAYRLLFNTNVGPSDTSARYAGHSVRCIAE